MALCPTAAAGAIDDVDRLAQLLFQQRADDPGGSVRAAAGAPGHDQRDGSFGIRGAGHGDEQQTGQRNECALHELHGISL